MYKRQLLDFVTSPYFTAETVQKEQGIIGQEITMYDDNPGWQVFFRLLGGLYHHLSLIPISSCTVCRARPA